MRVYQFRHLGRCSEQPKGVAMARLQAPES